MDPVIKAIVSGATESRKPLGDAAVKDAYAALKDGLRDRLGPKVRVTQALAALEGNPSDPKLQNDLDDAIARAMMGKPQGDKLTALASDLMAKSATKPLTGSGKAEEPLVDIAAQTDLSASANKEAPVEKSQPGLVRQAKKPELSSKRAMPAPVTLRRARNTFVLGLIVLIASVAAIVMLVIRENGKPKRTSAAAKVIPAAPVPSADSEPAPAPSSAAPDVSSRVIEPPVSEPVKPEIPAPTEPELPVTKPIEPVAKMKAEDSARARRVLHAIRNHRALHDRGRKPPVFKGDEEHMLADIAKAESCSVDELQELLTKYLTTMDGGDGVSEEDRAIIAFEKRCFDVAANSGVKAAEALVSRKSAGEEGAAELKTALSLYWLVGLSEKELGHLDECVTAFEKAAALTDEAKHPVAWADARLLLSTAAQRKGLYQRAMELLDLIVPVYQKALGDSNPILAIAVGNQALAQWRAGKVTFVEPLLNRAISIDEKGLGSDHPDVAIDLSNLAGFFAATNRGKEAEDLYQRALKMDEKALGTEHPAVAVDLANLANVMRASGHLAEAEAFLRRALSIDQKASGADHPDVALRLNNLAHLLASTQRVADAESMYREALRINELAYGPEHAVLGVTLTQLGELLLSGGKVSEAEAMFRRALKIAQKTADPDDPSIAVRLSNLAEVLRTQGRADEAEPLYAWALRIDEKNFGPVHPCVATDLTGLAFVYEKTNRLQEALPMYRRALKIAYIIKDETGKGHPEIGKWEDSFSTALLATGVSPPKVLEELQMLKTSVARK